MPTFDKHRHTLTHVVVILYTCVTHRTSTLIRTGRVFCVLFKSEGPPLGRSILSGVRMNITSLCHTRRTHDRIVRFTRFSFVVCVAFSSSFEGDRFRVERVALDVNELKIVESFVLSSIEKTDS